MCTWLKQFRWAVLVRIDDAKKSWNLDHVPQRRRSIFTDTFLFPCSHHEKVLHGSSEPRRVSLCKNLSGVVAKSWQVQYNIHIWLRWRMPMWRLSMLEKTAKSRKIWPNSNKFRKRFFKMKEDMLTSGTFIWIHQELLFNSRSFVTALNLCPHLEKSPFYWCSLSRTSCASLIKLTLLVHCVFSAHSTSCALVFCIFVARPCLRIHVFFPRLFVQHVHREGSEFCFISA